jgi:serine/threonine protein kinase
LQYLCIDKANKCNIVEICLIAFQLLDRLEWIHSKDLIYRDLKPENCLIGINDPNVIYIIDFGLCKKYRSTKTGKHILPNITGKFNGNIKYASPNVIKGKEASRRDDLISLGYMLIYLFKGKLPWDHIFKYINGQNYFELVFLKDTNGFGKLFTNLPSEMVEYIKYTRNLKFEQEPNYSYLRSLFNKIIMGLNLGRKSLNFSWINSSNKELVGLPRSSSKRKTSPQYRILSNIKEKHKKRLKSQIMDESNDKVKKNIFKIPNLPINQSTFFNIEQVKTNISSATNHDSNNNSNDVSNFKSENNIQNKSNNLLIRKKKGIKIIGNIFRNNLSLNFLSNNMNIQNTENNLYQKKLNFRTNNNSFDFNNSNNKIRFKSNSFVKSIKNNILINSSIKNKNENKKMIKNNRIQKILLRSQNPISNLSKEINGYTQKKKILNIPYNNFRNEKNENKELKFLYKNNFTSSYNKINDELYSYSNSKENKPIIQNKNDRNLFINDYIHKDFPIYNYSKIVKNKANLFISKNHYCINLNDSNSIINNTQQNQINRNKIFNKKEVKIILINNNFNCSTKNNFINPIYHSRFSNRNKSINI